MQKVKKSNAIVAVGLTAALALGSTAGFAGTAYAETPQEASNEPALENVYQCKSGVEYPLIIKKLNGETINSSVTVSWGESIFAAVDTKIAALGGYTTNVNWCNGGALGASETPNVYKNFDAHWVWDCEPAWWNAWIGKGHWELVGDTICVTYTQNSYTATYLDDQGKQIFSDDTDENFMVEEPASVDPNAAGAYFDHWVDQNGKTYAPGEIAGQQWKQDMEFTAVYKDMHTVTFIDGVDGQTIGTASVNDGYAVPSESVPGAPNHEGWNFNGWTQDGQAWDSAELINGDVTVTANYNPYVTFDFNLENTDNKVVEVENGSPVAQPELPAVAAGWSFDGWYTDEARTQAYDFDDPVTAPMTLYANWVKDPAAAGSADGVTPDGQNGANNGAQASDEAAAKDADALPQTGDNMLPFAAGAGVAALAGAAGIATAMRKRNER